MILHQGKDIKLNTEIKWETTLDTHSLNWEFYYTLPYKVTKESKLQMFQYKILHNILVTNSKLYYYQLRTNNRCSFCEIYKETIMHLLWDCKSTKSLWLQVQDWLRPEFNIIFTADTILLGSPRMNNNIPINHIILITKYYIYVSRCLDVIPIFKGLLDRIIYTIKIEKSIDARQANIKWSTIENIIKN